MRLMNKVNSRWLQMIFICLYLSACSTQIISEQDPQSLSMMEKAAQKVDYMFTKMSYMDANQRKYDDFSDYYLDVEVALNALKNRQESRALNQLTLKQVNIVLDLWRADRLKHIQKDTLSDFILKRHREQYQRLFTAIIKAESAKPQSKQ